MTRQQHEAGETLIELQSFADHAAEWLRANWTKVAALLLGVVVLAGAVAGVRAYRERQELAAATAVAAAQRDFLTKMGALPGTLDFEEPANPETAKTARREASDRMLALASEHPGTAAAVQARLEAAALLAQAGNGDRALEVLREVTAAGGNPAEITGLVELRIGQLEEAAGRWSEAAQAYQAAGEQRAFPLWPWALADAARALVEAGQREQAIRIAERLRTDAPDADLPPHLKAMLEELRAAGSPVQG